MPTRTVDLNKIANALNTRGWISLRQFAALIDVSYPTGLAMVNRGSVNAIRVGGIWRIYAIEVKRFQHEGNYQHRGTEGGVSSSPTPLFTPEFWNIKGDKS